MKIILEQCANCKYYDESDHGPYGVCVKAGPSVENQPTVSRDDICKDFDWVFIEKQDCKGLFLNLRSGLYIRHGYVYKTLEDAEKAECNTDIGTSKGLPVVRDFD